MATSGDYSVGQVTGAAPLGKSRLHGCSECTHGNLRDQHDSASHDGVRRRGGRRGHRGDHFGVWPRGRGCVCLGGLCGRPSDWRGAAASPTFTGTPSAPTATAGTSNTQIATTAFVATAVAAGGAVLSVFGRTGAIVATTGDYVVAQITGAAPLASPTFTGTVTLPAGTVSLAQQANFPAARLMGNPTGSAAAPSAISLGTNLSFAGSVLNATGGGGGMTNPMTTLGDVIYEDSTPTAVRLAGNTTSTNKFLTQTGTGVVSAAPAWNAIAVGDVPALPASKITSGQIPVTQGGTGLGHAPSTRRDDWGRDIDSGICRDRAGGPSAYRPGGWLRSGVQDSLPRHQHIMLLAMTTIQPGAVTLAKMANMSNGTLMGNPTGSPAAPSQITLGANLTFSGSTLVATGGAPGGTAGQIQTNNGSGGFGALPQPLPVGSGGTGLGTLTANAVVLGNGASTPGFATVGTAGRVLTDNGAGHHAKFSGPNGRHDQSHDDVGRYNRWWIKRSW